MEQSQLNMDQNETDMLSMLRTAQASQLRRRGALRGGAERRVGTRHSARDAEVPTPDEVMQLSQFQLNPPARQYRIYCGYADAASPSTSKSADPVPQRPFPLPIASQRLKRKYAESFLPVPSGPSPSNGCGQLLDTKACYSITMGCWITEEPLSSAPLDDQYTDILSTTENTWRRPISLSCGCHRQGFGCIVWYDNYSPKFNP
ncbi:uncharacterized protein EI90DRAFT_2080188 [Cantharellus anzutake]|uniref:uncharacterized protein n=1 Tax=Cantharellus anzutake TaxID=1750568 RepID=UPI0019044CC6|nr:uncharacterized protein EI90DRAFT_2080188 [Cantharellus anzutake]KAF8340536.1 hypothetical protein EI90DRAFT_2080188 [Cantharellus anzutake]